MRLVTFVDSSRPAPRVGVVRGGGDRLVDVGAAATQLGTALPFDPSDMISLIASGPAGLAAVAEIETRAGSDIALGEVRLRAPIPRTRKNVFCVGWNYVAHFEEGAPIRTGAQEMPEHPTFFSKAPTAINGPYDAIPFDAHVSHMLDWEAELGVVIGAGGKNIPEADAINRVFGFTVINDLSWRDLQRRHGGQWFKGKSLDGSCPMGPWIVTRDEVDPTNLRITSRVNGVTKQDSSTSHMYFKIPRIVAELSQGLTLEPGDVIATGTPAGVGHARTPPEYMKPGDVLETEIAGLGTLRNTIAG